MKEVYVILGNDSVFDSSWIIGIFEDERSAIVKCAEINLEKEKLKSLCLPYPENRFLFMDSKEYHRQCKVYYEQDENILGARAWEPATVEKYELNKIY